jgi:predicted nucleic acid-binding protein
VLDSNAAIAALNGVEGMRRRLAAVDAVEIGIPIVAVAELLFGANKSRRRDENLARVAALRRAITTLPLTDSVVERYASIRARLEGRGLVKSDFDLLIACTALDLGAVLVTSDRALLDGSIDGLEAENWLE